MADHDELFPLGPTVDITDEEFEAAVSPPDTKGRINLRIEQMLEEEIHSIAENTEYPLYSASEVVRFCCMHGLDRLRQWKPRPTLLGALKAANALAVRDKLQCDALTMIERLDERMHWYIEHEHFDEAIDFIAKMRSYFDGVRADFWSRYIVEKIDGRFAYWVEAIEQAQKKA
jgi:hypothetical protein